MASRLYLSNDNYTSTNPNGGWNFDEEVFSFNVLANESSGQVTSANTLQPLFTAPNNGRIVDFWIGVTTIGVSASGFVSGTLSAQININSAAVCSTVPAIVGPSTSANSVRGCTCNGPNSAFVSSVVNAASAQFSAGDQISLNWTMQSGNSGTVVKAGTGFVVGWKVRYDAR